MMTGYLPPTDGRVVIDGLDMFDQPDKVKKRIGYLPEQPPVYHDMTVNEYLRFAGQIRGVKKPDLKGNVNRVAALCGISDKLGRLIGNLSKGYRQRVGLAQALVHDPDILILDEPTVGLDPKQIIEIRELIRSLGKERTVILSSHILQEVTSLCRKVAIINEGRLVAFDTIARLSEYLKRVQTLIVAVAYPERIDLAAIRAIRGVASAEQTGDGRLTVDALPDSDIRAGVAEKVIGMGAGLVEMKNETLTLEEIFLKVITGGEGAQDVT